MKKVTTAKKTKDIMQEFKWKTVENTLRGRLTSFGKDVIVIRLRNQKNGHGHLVMKMGIRIGSEKAKELGFVAGNRLIVMYDEDDLLHFLLVKSNTDKGYKLTSQGSGSDVLFFNMKWDLPIKVHEIKSQVLDYELVNGHINFRVPQ